VLVFTSITAEVLKLNAIAVSWQIQDTDEDISNFHFTVTKSFSPGGPFEPISQPLVNLFSFMDTAEQMKSNWRKIYYRVSAKDVITGQVLLSDIADLTSPADFVVLEIRRREDLYLRRYVGVRAAVFIQKTWGRRCGSCWDQRKQRVSKSTCRTCFNTGYDGGYFPQVNQFVNFSPSPELVQLLETGERQQNNTNLWLGNYPLLSPRDMIVEFPSKKHWRVVTVGKTEHKRAVLRQIAQIVEITRSDVEYDVPVNDFPVPPDPFIGFYPPTGSGLL